MSVEKLILWYLKIYEGNWANTKLRVIAELCKKEGISQAEASCQADQTLRNLEFNKKIRLIPCEEMTDNQKLAYEQNGLCVFYEIL